MSVTAKRIAPLTDEERASHLKRFAANTCPEPNSGCLLWLGNVMKPPKEKCLRGKFWLCGKNVLATRAAWVLAGRELPDGMFVLHTCDVSLCVRIDHLFLGDHAANMRDLALRRRGSKSRSGLPRGVRKSCARFAASSLWHSGKLYLGTFDTPEEASRVVESWLAQKYGIDVSEGAGK